MTREVSPYRLIFDSDSDVSSLESLKSSPMSRCTVRPMLDTFYSPDVTPPSALLPLYFRFTIRFTGPRINR